MGLSQDKRKQHLLLGLTILTLAFIWGNSLMPGTVSDAFSQRVGEVLSRIFGGVMDQEEGHGVLRKLAHGTEYLVLGVELSLLLRLWKKHWSQLLLCGVGAALIDETIQLFVEGRSGAIRDVWIDLGGFCTGCLICVGILALRNRRKT